MDPLWTRTAPGAGAAGPPPPAGGRAAPEGGPSGPSGRAAELRPGEPAPGGSALRLGAAPGEEAAVTPPRWGAARDAAPVVASESDGLYRAPRPAVLRSN